MARTDYIPDSDNDLLAWYDQFNIACNTMGTLVGLTGPELTQISGDNADFHSALTALESAKMAQRAAVAAKNDARRTAVGHARDLAARIRANTAYTEALGASFGLLGAAVLAGPERPDLFLRGAAVAGSVTVGFQKGTWSGVELRCRRGTEAAFSFLARDTESPYVDTRPNLDPSAPETRQYTARFLDGDEAVGPDSDVLVLTVPQ